MAGNHAYEMLHLADVSVLSMAYDVMPLVHGSTRVITTDRGVRGMRQAHGIPLYTIVYRARAARAVLPPPGANMNAIHPAQPT